MRGGVRTWQQEQLALLDLNLLEFAILNDAQVHGTLHLVEQLLRRLRDESHERT